MAREERQVLSGVAKHVRWILPGQLPRATFHERTREAALLKGEVHVVGHEHLGRVRDRDRLLEQLFEAALRPEHRLLELDDVDVEQPRVIRLDAHDLDVRAGAKALEGVEDLAAPSFRLYEERVA